MSEHYLKLLDTIDTDQITADNVSAAADAAVNNAGDIIDALTNNADIKIHLQLIIRYLVGLSQGKGAVSVYSAVNQSVTDSASTVQALQGWLSKGIRWMRHH